MEAIRSGEIAEFADAYKGSARVGEGLNYRNDWHWEEGELSTKGKSGHALELVKGTKGAIIKAAHDAKSTGHVARFAISKLTGRVPIVKYGLVAMTFSAGRTFASEELGLDPWASSAVGTLEMLNPLPIGLQDVYELGQDDLLIYRGRRRDDVEHILRTGEPLYRNDWGRLFMDDPPSAMRDNPDIYGRELLEYWGYR
jgi:hypothetical protein